VILMSLSLLQLAAACEVLRSTAKQSGGRK
jgi:hypothetical protein